MFVLLWGPTVAAVSVVLDHAEAVEIVGTAVDGLLHAARIAAFHHVDEARPHAYPQSRRKRVMSTIELPSVEPLQLGDVAACTPPPLLLPPHTRC